MGRALQARRRRVLKEKADFDTTQLNRYVHYRYDSAVFNGSNELTAWNDLSGNDNHINTIVGTPTNVASGINGLPSILIPKGAYTSTDSVERLDYAKINVYVVYQLKAASGGYLYNNVFMLGTTTDISAGLSFLELRNTTNTDDFIANFSANALDTTKVATQLDPHYAMMKKDETDFYFSIDGGSYTVNSGTQNVQDRVILGGWGNPVRGNDVWISEFIIIKQNITEDVKQKLIQYTFDKYGI